MFPYLRTAEDFIIDCGGETVKCDNSSSECKECNRKSELVKWLEDSVRKANWRNYIKEGEVKAWCQSVCYYMKDVISEVIDNNPDLKLAIGLEYYLETRVNFGDEKKPHYRADFMIGGYGKDGNGEPEMRVLVIELKQYSEISQIIEETGKIKWKWEYNDDSDLEEQPNSQVKFYAENLNDSVNNIEGENIKFIPCVYMHNLKADKICGGNYIQEGKNCNCDYSCNDNILEDENVVYDNTPVKVFLKGSDFAGYISDIFNCKGDGLKVFKEIRRRYQTFSLKELADILTCKENKLKEYEKRLRPDQFFILNGYVDNKKWDNYIKKHIDYIKSLKEGEDYIWKRSDNKSFNENSILDVIEGGPGSGKTLLAMLIIRYCRDNELSVSFINCKSAPKNAICKYLKKDSENEEKYKVKRDVFQKKYIKYFNRVDSDVYILDEAHTIDRDISGIIKNKMQGESPKLIICMYDKRQILNENSLVFINNIEGIDGFKKDESNVIQTNTTEVGKCNKYKIWSQFRCNRDEGFVSWIEDKFKIENSSYPRPFVNYINSPASFDYDVEIIDKDDLNGEFLEDIRDKIDEGSLFALSEDVDNDEIKEMLDMNKSVQKPYIPGTLKSADDGIIYRGDTTTICGIENEEILVFVKDVYKNNEIICDEITKNKYRILLTRGLKKCYICCLDDGLKEYLLR